MAQNRTHVIGDIHGCAGALDALLEALWPDPDNDRLILLGDLFDRGPDSYEVWQRVRALEETYGDRFTLLRGNHEDYLLNTHLSWRERIIWDRVGRAATVASFRRHGADMYDAAPWLRDTCRLFARGEGFQCVHAGVKVDPIEMNDRYTLLHDHEVALQNRYAGLLTIIGHIALSKPMWLPGGEETPVLLTGGVWRPLPDHGVICVDTGCGKGGCLTAMTIEDDRYTLTDVPEDA